MDKREIATILEEIGLLLELRGDSPFKSRAYYNAARTVEGISENIDDLVASGRIRELQGIGQALAEKLAELVATGRLPYYDQLKQAVPPDLVEMTAIPGLGPKKIAALWNQLGITTVGELEYACIENRLLGLSGFGQKTQDKIQQGIMQMKRRMGFHLYANVIDEAQRILEVVKGIRYVRHAEVVGEVRRRMEVVSSIVLLAATDHPDRVVAGLQSDGEVADVTVIGQKVVGKSSLGLPVHILVSRELTPHALLAYTGNEEHLRALASRAASLKVPWNLETNGAGELTPAADSEQELYARLELPYIEPELREGLREIEAASAGQLGPLVETQDIQGVFHNHTTYSDGSATLDEMVAAAKALGYRYIGISDHSQSAFYANGLKEDRIREQHAAIDALRKRMSDIAIFKGIEADILSDGAMDYSDDVLARFDFVIGSVHSRFNLSEEEQTARVIRALANPFVTMLGHPTGRLLLSREGYRVDMKRVIDAAKAYGKVIEVNANPHRLDLDWRFCQYAKSQGVKVSINPDAHATEGLGDVPFGVNIARKGSLGPRDVVNTLGPDQILPALSQHPDSP